MKPTSQKQTLSSKVVDDLRKQIRDGIFKPGDRLPSESDLANTYEVSRPTIRAALRELEWSNQVQTKHGVGTFVRSKPAISAGLEKLESISESIRATGREPSMDYVMRLVRKAMPEEAAAMEMPADTEVLELRRCILADSEIVAYSYDLLLTSIFPAEFDPHAIQGSIFQFVQEELGITPKEVRAEVQPIYSEYIGWGEESNSHNHLFLLLKQLHYNVSNELFLFSRTYFIDGRYTFNLIRR